jgi:hypothetical protein
MATDVLGWVQRAKEFLRQLTYLPGKLLIRDGIEPPCEKADWLNSPECSVPDDVKQFLRLGSNRCGFTYRWQPPAAFLPQLQAIVPGAIEIVGGADFCEAAVYFLYDHQESLNRNGRVVRERALQMFPPELQQEMEARLPLSLFGIELDDRGDLLRLAPLPDNSKLSLSLKADSPGGVVLTSADHSERLQLCDSFAEFLSKWEQACYVQPTKSQLQPWLDAAGRLNPDAEKSARMRTLLLSFSPQTGGQQ